MEWKKIDEILNNDIEIPGVVEERFAETTNKILQMEEKGKSMKKDKKWIAAVCSMILVLVSSVGALAGTGFFEKKVKQEENNLTYTFEIDYDLTVHSLKVTPEYLPEGYEEWMEDKYSLNGAYGADGISLWPVTTVNLEAMGSSMNLINVESVETIEINGMEADVVIREENGDGTQYNCIILFNQAEGYVIQVMGTNKLAIDELIKVASNLKVEVTDEVQNYMSASEAEKKAAIDAALKEWVWEPKVVKPENIMQINEEMKNPLVVADPDSEMARELGYDIGYTVTNIKILDNIQGLDTEDFYDYEGRVAPWLNEDGTLKPYERITRSGADTSVVFTDTVSSKFVAITVSATNYLDMEHEMITNELITYLEENSEGNIQSMDIFTEPVNISKYTLQWDSSPIYLDNSQNAEGEARIKSFFIGSLAGNETIEYTLVFVVDEDKLEEAYFTLDYGQAGMTIKYEDGIAVIDDSMVLNSSTFVKIQ